LIRRTHRKEERDDRWTAAAGQSSTEETDHAFAFARWPLVEDGDAKREDELRDRPRVQLLVEPGSEVQVRDARADDEGAGSARTNEISSLLVRQCRLLLPPAPPS